MRRPKFKPEPECPPAVDGLQPPHDLIAEASCISAVLTDQTKFDACSSLKPEHFYSEAHRRIWEAVCELAAADRPIDMTMVAAVLKSHGRLEQVGGTSYITDVIGAVPFISNAGHYAQIVRDKAQVRELQTVCARAAAMGYIDHGDDKEFCAKVIEDLSAVVLADVKNPVVSIGKTTKEVFAALRANRGGMSGVSTGYERYDKLTAGLHDSDLTIVAGRPGMGKTSFALNVGVNVAAGDHSSRDPATQRGLGVMIFSLEMPREQLVQRMMCTEARVDLGRMRDGKLMPEDWNRLTAAATKLAPLPIWIDDTPGITLMELRAKVRRQKAEFDKGEADDPARKRLGVVMVDYLQLMTGAGGEQSREQEISAISRGLKGLAKELRVAVVALSQLNRSVETRSEKNKRPQLSDLRESGAIEQDADNICFIYRDDYYNEDSQEKNVAELIIGKQRSGPTGVAKVRFDREHTRFDNLAYGEYEDRDAAE